MSVVWRLLLMLLMLLLLLLLLLLDGSGLWLSGVGVGAGMMCLGGGLVAAVELGGRRDGLLAELLGEMIQVCGRDMVRLVLLLRVGGEGRI